MKTKKIYLVRHGQTEYNKINKVQGCGVDAPLNSTGRMQAAAFYEKYKDYPFDKVYTSVLRRSVESVQRFINDGIPHEKLAGLNEINWGVMEGQPFSLVEDNYYTKMTKAWEQGDLDASIENGESPNQVMQRQKEAMEYILSKENEDTILICMHGRAIRILLCHIQDIDLCEMDRFPHSNMGLYILNYEDGKFSIEKTNDIEHYELMNSNILNGQEVKK